MRKRKNLLKWVEGAELKPDPRERLRAAASDAETPNWRGGISLAQLGNGSRDQQRRRQRGGVCREVMAKETRGSTTQSRFLHAGSFFRILSPLKVIEKLMGGPDGRLDK